MNATATIDIANSSNSSNQTNHAKSHAYVNFPLESVSAIAEAVAPIDPSDFHCYDAISFPLRPKYKYVIARKTERY
jgi:hypothetical protein